MNKKISKLYIFKLLVQIIFLIFLPGLFVLTFDGLRNIYQMVLAGNFSFTVIFPHLVEALAIIPLTAILGRFFCGWFCAFGTMNDLIYLAAKKIFKVKFKINSKLDSMLKYLKYIILAIAIGALWTTGSTIFGFYSPWNAFAQIGTIKESISLYTGGFVILALIIVGAFFIERFFCRYLCPLGAFFSIISKLRIFKIKKPTFNCGKCKICTNNCPMGISLYASEKVDSGECIDCFNCISACPAKNPHMVIASEVVKPAVASAVAIAAFSSVYTADNLALTSMLKNNLAVSGNPSTSVEASVPSNNMVLTPVKPSTRGNTANSGSSTANTSTNANKSSAASSADTKSIATNTAASTKKYNDGTYTGEGFGYRPGLQVSVTVKNDKITNVEILSNNETPQFAMMPFQVVPKEILAAQSTDVDAVSGATRSSRGIMEAVANALSQAQI